MESVIYILAMETFSWVNLKMTGQMAMEFIIQISENCVEYGKIIY